MDVVMKRLEEIQPYDDIRGRMIRRCLMDRDKLVEEIRRVEDALKNTRSPKLKKDYGKHLRRLYQNLRYYDRSMERWQTKRTLSEVTKPIS